MMEIVIDANNAILGRLASYAAKQSMLGKKVIIVNCKDVVIIGKPSSILKDYNVKRQRGGAAQKGPFFPKYPSRIVKRTIRGMLSYKQGRGLDAFKRIICYDSVPAEYADVKKLIAGKEKKMRKIKLETVSQRI
jgi:large subunit ribosomal protein L13